MSQLDDILALTQKVEALIAEGCWAEASALEVERREQLVSYVASEGKEAPGLRELYDRSVRSMSGVQQTKKTLAGDASRAIGNSRAVDAYLDNAGSDNVRGGV